MQPFFGYPGGKSRAVKRINQILSLNPLEYDRIVEPMCGGCSYTLSSDHPSPWINDVDADLFCLWKSVVNWPDDLCEMIRAAKPKASDFYRLREKILKKPSAPSRKPDILSRALEKLILHKISFSNMGEKSGSPVGGKNQTGKWKFDCRWNTDSICKNIAKASSVLRDAKVTHRKYPKVLSEARKGDLFFVDPPYVDAGVKCYKHSFTLKDHTQLANMLIALPCDWVLTYDYHPLVLELYSGLANIYDLEFNYFMSSAYSSGETMKIGKELLITNLQQPDS